MSENTLIYDWNPVEEVAGTALVDATLAEASRWPTLGLPTIEHSLTHIEYLLKLGVSDVELPDPENALALLRQVQRAGLGVRPSFLLGIDQAELHRAAELSQELGMAVEVFINVSPPFDPGWLEKARALELRVGIALESAGSLHPVALARLLRAAAEAGAHTIELRDSEGYATGDEVRHLVSFAVGLLRDGEFPTELLWSGSDVGELGVANALVACRAGAARVRASALGLGGGIPLDLLVVNLTLEDHERGTESLRSFCLHAAEACGVEIPSSYPVFGRDAFRTATGVHAAAIVKSPTRWLADRVYSGVPASRFGADQIIEVGPMSGRANVVRWLENHELTVTPGRVHRLLQLAKRSDHVLTDVELLLAMEAVG